MPKLIDDDRCAAWFDGSAVCVIAVGTHGDPLDLGDKQVEGFIEKLHQALAQSKAS
jgi:hypothetical protein